MKKQSVALTIGALFVFSLSVAEASDVGISVTFSDSETRIIRAWYDDHRPTKSGRPDKGARTGLPPGIAKNLARGKSIPPGIAKQYLPEGLRKSLPAPPSGHERVIVGGKILLVEIATQVIHDVLTDVILR